MRFRKIQFENVGPFASTTLDFREGARVHVVQGANEAGKSSALRQIVAFLFGFEPQSGDNFIHSYQNHRIRAEIACLDGQVRAFTRTRSPRTRSLGPGFPVPDGLDREDFLALFGITQDSLRTGADNLLKNGPSALRSLLFDAVSGIPSSAAVGAAIRSRKEQLLRTRSGKIQDAVQAVRGLEERVREHENILAERGREILELEGARRQRDSVQEAIRLLEGEARDLGAISAGLAVHELILASRQRFAEFGEIPEIRDSFTGEWRQAAETLAEAMREEDRAGHEIAAARRELEGIPPAAVPEGLPDSIPSLAGQVERVRDALSRIPLLEGNLEGVLSEAGALLATRCPGGDPGQLAEILPPARAVERIRKAAGAVSEAATASTTAETELALARDQVQVRLAAMEGLPVPAIPPELPALLVESEKAGDLERALAESTLDLEIRSGQLLAKCASMTPPIAGFTELERLRIPPRGEVAAVEESWKSVNDQVADARARAGQDRTELERIELELEGTLAASGSVDPELVKQARGLRDRAWAIIRTQREGSEAMNADISGVLAGEAGASTVDEALTLLIDRVDRLADSQLNNATAVLDISRARAQLARLRQRREDSAAEIATLEAQLQPVLDNLAQIWSERWLAGGSQPPGPMAVGEWMQRAGDLKNDLTVIRGLETRVADLRGRCAGLLARFQAQFPGLQGGLAALCHHANAMVTGWERQEQALVQARKSLEEAERHAESRTRAARERQDVLQQRREEFFALVQPPWSCVPGDHAGFAEDLSFLERSGKEAGRMDAELAGLRKAWQTFAAELSSVALQAGISDPHISADNWETVWSRLQRLAREETARAQQATACARRIANRESSIPEIQGEISRARQKVQELLDELGVQEAGQVPALLDRYRERARLRDELRDREQRLLEDTRMGPEEYAAARNGRARADVDERIAGIGHELEELRRRDGALSTTIAGAERALGELLGNEKGLKLRSELELNRVKLHGLMAEWRRLRLAELCLDEAAEQARSGDGETPVAWAKEHLDTMTLGRYSDLEMEQGEEGFSVRVTRPDPGYVEARATIRNSRQKSGLSEGTADQLWMAIRLAGIRMRVLKMREEGIDPLPVIIDDALVSFDDDRAVATIEVLAGIGELTQVILFTHHSHIALAARDQMGDAVDLVTLPGPGD